MKIVKHLLILASAAALLAGCATDRHNTGAPGDYNETGYGNSSDDNAPLPSEELPEGPNGSVGRGNPLGVGGGVGLVPAH
ncbi:MAG: hypothetical protein JWQ04_1671 [Pedosphaera sp.]|nr:hypothetical protein [Pedosphaera sp.]